MRRPLPSAEEARRILAERPTRPARRPPPPAARALAVTLKALDAKFGAGVGDLDTRWREVVGETLARLSRPIRLIAARGGTEGTLEIRVEGPAAVLVQHQAGEIMARANLFLGAGAVGKLRIAQGPLARSPGVAGPTARGRGPLDAAAERSLAESVAHLPEGPLKGALTRLGREVLRAQASPGGTKT
jgi:hypothetical protein